MSSNFLELNFKPVGYPILQGFYSIHIKHSFIQMKGGLK